MQLAKIPPIEKVENYVDNDDDDDDDDDDELKRGFIKTYICAKTFLKVNLIHVWLIVHVCFHNL
jgi:hypothetical protein